MSEIRDITTLYHWDRNQEFRSASDLDRERAKKNLELGQLVPLLIRPDGKVIGGNHTLDGMLELEYTTAKVTVLDFGTDENGLYYPIIDGDIYKDAAGNIPFKFTSIEEGEVAVAASHNSKFAKYKEEPTKALMEKYPLIDWKMFTGDFRDPVNLGTIKSLKEEVKQPAEKVSFTVKPKMVKCPECGKEFDAKKHKAPEDDDGQDS
jgi:hypothetical protein